MDMEDQLTGVRKMAEAETSLRGRIITITSGKGGVGKSNIALNLSIALAQMGKSVTLFDADTHLANLNILTGNASDHTLADVVFGDKSISELMFDHPTGVKIVSAGSGMNMLAGLEEGVKQHFFQEIYNLCYSDDFILVDTSAGLSETVADFAIRADEVIVITTPEPTAVSDAYALVKILFGMKRRIRFKTLINLVKSEDEAEEVFERFCLVIQHFLQTDTDFLGYLVEDKHVRQAVQKQNPFISAFPNSKASRCIHHIAERMTS